MAEATIKKGAARLVPQRVPGSRKESFSLVPAVVARPGVTTLHYKYNIEGTLRYSSTTGTASWTAVDCRDNYYVPEACPVRVLG